MATIDLQGVKEGNTRAIARAISLIESGYAEELHLIDFHHSRHIPVMGITGPPGAGKSTLVDKLIQQVIDAGKRVAVLCVDPSSPFHNGSILGDRIRLNSWYNHKNVFIRSLASRGAVGGLHPQIMEITSLLNLAPFDYIIIETVGVGQNEVAIVGLADVSVVVLVPEAGDDIQTMKSGLMEIADIFVINKSDRPDAGKFLANLKRTIQQQLHPKKHALPILQTVATQNEGIGELFAVINKTILEDHPHKSSWLLAERAYAMIARHRMRDVSKHKLIAEIEQLQAEKAFDFYTFVARFNN
ncbi:methylmalonyl Co-A mutase-associated GTPase MeaB [Flavihumibacter petaseus]|uniref:Putative GTPase n=1 Tax=Flavihumibacter petaseus NBRC 106054 TaxID=1220578 RepID=A0A0E9MY68_9BACT|nr:methylmalonyl Co-A mutase-associated GTPase MeaB [Flavihumibacter petaseus]GAO42075.1 putative GTPase [Flavihumibacter petaseus NBRC 106054]